MAVEVVLVLAVADALSRHLANGHELFGAVALDDLRLADVQCVALWSVVAGITLEDPSSTGGSELRDGQESA